LLALLFYMPINERLLPSLQSGDAAASDMIASGVLSYASVACVFGVVLTLMVGGISAAQRKRNISGYNFFVLTMLVAAYGLLGWVHMMG
jgi:hypothetical protein